MLFSRWFRLKNIFFSYFKENWTETKVCVPNGPIKRERFFVILFVEWFDWTMMYCLVWSNVMQRGWRHLRQHSTSHAIFFVLIKANRSGWRTNLKSNKSTRTKKKKPKNSSTNWTNHAFLELAESVELLQCFCDSFFWLLMWLLSVGVSYRLRLD